MRTETDRNQQKPTNKKELKRTERNLIGQRLTYMERKGQKQTETDRNNQKRTETDSNGQNQSETNRNGQK